MILPKHVSGKKNLRVKASTNLVQQLQPESFGPYSVFTIQNTVELTLEKIFLLLVVTIIIYHTSLFMSTYSHDLVVYKLLSVLGH